MWTSELISSNVQKIETALKSEHDGHRVLLGEIGAKGEDPDFARLFPNNVPAILVLSQGATEAYAADNYIFLQYGVSREPILDKGKFQYFKIAEAETDCLAYLRVGADGQVEAQGASIEKWLQIDFTRQRLGLAIITAKEGNNSMARFWAETFVFNKE